MKIFKVSILEDKWKKKLKRLESLTIQMELEELCGIATSPVAKTDKGYKIFSMEIKFHS